MKSLSGPGERSLAGLLSRSHLASGDQMAEIIAVAASELGAVHTSVLLIDIQQTCLVDLDSPGMTWAVDGTVEGLAFRQSTVECDDVDDETRVCVPLLDGLERLGVMVLRFPTLADDTLDRARRLASLTTELLLAKLKYADTIKQASRREPLSLAAEIQWELIPPLTAGTEKVTLAAMLEPAYDVGGDVFDYSLHNDVAHLAILDAMGHGLSASLCSSLAVGAYRNARRAGADLPETVAAIEAALWQQFRGDRYTTGIFAQLDLDAGDLTWINAGHPPALLLRGGRVIKQLRTHSRPPLGLNLNRAYPVNRERLQPADRVLFYTDGVVENRPAGQAEEFGLERLVEFLTRADAEGEELPETMRRLSHALLAHHGGTLRDDASQMLVEWRGGSGQALREQFAAGAVA